MTDQAQYVYSEFGTDEDMGFLVDMFVEEMPDRVQSILDALEAEDWDALKRVAHQLKGAGGSYGFNQITPVAAVLENRCVANEPEELILQSADELVGLCRNVRAGGPE